MTEQEATPKQKDLIPNRGIKALDMAAEKLYDIRIRRLKLQEKESEAQDELVATMKQHKKQTYKYNGMTCERKPGKEKVSVRKNEEE